MEKSRVLLQVFLMTMMIVCAAFSAYLFAHESPVLGAINAVFAVINLVSLIRNMFD